MEDRFITNYAKRREEPRHVLSIENDDLVGRENGREWHIPLRGVNLRRHLGTWGVSHGASARVRFFNRPSDPAALAQLAESLKSPSPVPVASVPTLPRPLVRCGNCGASGQTAGGQCRYCRVSVAA